MDKLIEKFREEIQEFSNTCNAFYNGEIPMAQYKSSSGGFGTYSERGHKTGMLRLRIPGGDLSSEKFSFVCKQIKKYNIKKIHFTTNQSIQLHNLPPAEICQIMQDALEVGIITRGGGGDFPRNALCSPLSGVQKNEAFDVLPYAKAVSNYVIQFIGKVKLPRKIKIGFSNSPENLVHATYRDMGFVARYDGLFDLYTAGGLGPNPALGIKTAEGIKPQDVLYYVKTMVQLFTEYGNYEIRAKARTRYIPREIGEEKYIEEFHRILKEIKEKENLTLDLSLNIFDKVGDGSKPTANRNIVEQKQDGLFAVKYHPVSGFPDFEVLQKLYEAISHMHQVSVRLSPKEEAYIINLTGKEADLIWNIIKEDTASTKLQESVTCIGASICQVGVADSRGLLKKIIDMEKEENFPNGILPPIFISGCPSSCGTHQTGLIGFQGGKKRVDGNLVDIFQMYIGGCETQDKEAFGELIGSIPETKIPDMLREIGREISSSNLCFEKWLSENKNRLIETAKKYTI